MGARVEASPGAIGETGGPPALEGRRRRRRCAIGAGGGFGGGGRTGPGPGSRSRVASSLAIRSVVAASFSMRPPRTMRRRVRSLRTFSPTGSGCPTPWRSTGAGAEIGATLPSRLKTDSREPATYCFNGDPVAVSYTGGLGPIRDIGWIWAAGGAKKPSYWACAAILEGFEYYEDPGSQETAA